MDCLTHCVAWENLCDEIHLFMVSENKNGTACCCIRIIWLRSICFAVVTTLTWTLIMKESSDMEYKGMGRGNPPLSSATSVYPSQVTKCISCTEKFRAIHSTLPLILYVQYFLFADIDYFVCLPLLWVTPFLCTGDCHFLY